MKKLIVIISILFFSFCSAGTASAAFWWTSQETYLVAVAAGDTGIDQIQYTHAGLTNGVWRTINPAATNKNAIIAVALTAIASGKKVCIQFEGLTVVGLRIIAD
jgi:hypothetical protein